MLNVLKKATLISVATIGFSTAAMASNSIDDQVTVTNVSGNGVMISSPTAASNFNANPNNDKLNVLIGQLSNAASVQASQSTTNFANFNTPSTSNPSSLVSGLIAKAKNFIGLPYRFGGTSPVSGFDCSGFMQYVYKTTANINLPRTSGDMSRVGEKVSRDNLKPGDMVFFSHDGGHISHVGMYIGEGRFIHSPSTGKSISITALNSGYWANKFVTARRVLSDNA